MAQTRFWTLYTAVAVCLLQCSTTSTDIRQPITIDTDVLLQTVCGFNCTSGECLTEERVCDGTVDCADKSDETENTCRNYTFHCPAYAFLCDYGACVDADVRCNGKMDCADASDERNCDVLDNSTCKFQCTSGECLEAHKVCDGSVDCLDRSDETSERCSLRTDCPAYAMRCDYGGCVDSDARCDGKTDCADGSDENNCPIENHSCRAGTFQCDNGACVSRTNLCDGQRDCIDGSDETKKQCEFFMCPSYAFRCDYGACIDGDEVCDGKPHCADGSDETTTVCASTTPKHVPCSPLNHPAHGQVKVMGSMAQFFCEPGYSLTGPDTIPCHKGVWGSQPPSCIADDNTIPGSGSSPSTSDWYKLLLILLISAFAQWA